ncbi:hypothetical protein EDB81DRAFT_785614 [Dactylonectria macrodidyma]|uniref:Zn(2)-C6 fungal-type domain-containing protein n=1 Tax=Dactylonectria macrodidyma TaxID=307937 RepID=A0A9P9FJ10_9HYPO|nr:hypothetical protein EDB81DRAFT_785614 [Dactylonectria macrodidyma]
MYAPVAARPRKTDIVRSRGGCLACRRKKRKCNERKPSCQRCVEGGSKCVYERNFTFRDATTWAADRVRQDRRNKPLETAAPEQLIQVGLPSPLGSPALEEQDQEELPAPSIANVVGSQGSSVELHDANSTDQATPPSISLETICNSSVGHDREGQEEVSPDVGLLCSPGLLDQDAADMVALPADTQPREMWEDTGLPFSLNQDTPPYTQGGQGLYLSSGVSFQYLTTHVPSLEDLSPPQDDMQTNDAAVGQNQEFLNSLSARNDQDGTADVGIFATPSEDVASSPSSNGPQLHIPTNIPVRQRVFLAHFAVHVLDIIPGHDGALHGLDLRIEAVRFAAMALAAANLANTEGHKTAASGTWNTWKPNKSHMMQAENYREKALSLSNDLACVDALFATQLLLSYMEMELGTVTNLRQCTRRLETIMLNHWVGISDSSLGRALLSSALHVDLMLTTMAGPCHPWKNESSRACAMSGLSELFGSPSYLIDRIGSDATFIGLRILICRAMQRDNASMYSTLNKLSQWWGIIRGVHAAPEEQINPADFENINNEDELLEQLESLKMTLQSYQVPRGFQLLDERGTDDRQGLQDGYENIEPIHFMNHRDAMDNAAYMYALIMTEKGPILDALQPRPRPAESNRSATPCPSTSLYLLLRIAAGLDPAECARQNIYRHGIIRMLYHASLKYNDPHVLKFVERLIDGISASGASFEDSYTPLRLTRVSVSALRQQMDAGRTVFMMTSSHGANTEKHAMFSELGEEVLLVHGREADGRYFNNTIPLMDLEGESSHESPTGGCT